MKVLLSPLGLAPGVVTGAYYALEPDYGRMDRIITITTSNPQAKACEMMIADEVEKIESEGGHFVDYAPSNRKRVRHKLLENREHVMNFYRKVRNELSELERAGDEVYLNLTGGHKSMIAAAAMAAQFIQPRECLGGLGQPLVPRNRPPPDQRRKLLDLPLHRVGGVRPDKRHRQPIPPGHLLGLLELTRPGNDPHRQPGRAAIVVELLDEQIGGGVPQRGVDQGQLVVG